MKRKVRRTGQICVDQQWDPGAGSWWTVALLSFYTEVSIGICCSMFVSYVTISQSVMVRSVPVLYYSLFLFYVTIISSFYFHLSFVVVTCNYSTQVTFYLLDLLSFCPLFSFASVSSKITLELTKGFLMKLHMRFCYLSYELTRWGRTGERLMWDPRSLTVIIIIIIFINCNWVVTRWQWLFYMYTKYEIGC